MTKKIIALAVFTTLTFGFTACNNDDSNPVQFEQVALEKLPKNTQQLIEDAFPNATLLEANKVSKLNYYGSFYLLRLDNKIEINFDREGNWTEIETIDHSALPVEFLMQEVPLIQAYVVEHYNSNFIIEIDRDRQGYEVTLNSELELIFNVNQEFVGVDLDLDNDEQLINYQQLPTAAQALLKTHFSTAEVVLIKQENDEEGTEYKVYLNDGFKIEFNQQGDWKEIETKQNKAIPVALLPTPLTTYIQANYSVYKLVGIEKNRVFEVELVNGKQELELIFDLAGNFLKIDR